MKKVAQASLFDHNKSVNPRYRLVMFDFDGTLCNTAPADVRAIQSAYQSLDLIPPTTEALYKVLSQGLVIQNCFKALSPQLTAQRITALLAAYQKFYNAEAKHAELFPGAIPLLKTLKTKNVNMIVVSNKAKPALLAAVTALGLNTYFDQIVGEQKDTPCKPDAKLFFSAIAPYFPTIVQQDILMVGDTSTDLTFAANITVDACWASYGWGTADTCHALKPAHTIHMLSELESIILPVH